jgi:preprotein translocase subunit SecA
VNLLKKIFGDKHSRDIKKILPLVKEINRFCDTFNDLREDEFPQRTEAFKRRIAEARDEVRAEMADEPEEEIEKAIREEENLIIEEILPEAFALVKQVCKRLMGRVWNVRGIPMEWDMIPYDVQLVGAVVLHEGKIAEMATGEGKTLVATMPLYLNALTGRGVHLVTVNDYLAARDTEWMGEIYKMLGVSVGCILNDMNSEQRKIEYACDVTYGTNNEFGFDYLRDNMSIRAEDQVQRGHHYAIVDEVDSVLIDEARTPLIISGPVEISTQMYDQLKPPVERTIKAQTVLVNQLIQEAEQLIDDGKEYEAGIKILQAHHGFPKNKRLMKLLNETGTKKLMQSVENDFIRDKKMNELDEALYFTIDEKQHIADLTEKGRLYTAPNNPDMFILPDLTEGFHEIDSNPNLSPEEKAQKKQELIQLDQQRSEQNHNTSQLLRAYSLFEKDVEYVLQDGLVIIVDEFTGRLMPGRRYSDGLHQAIEAKENVKIERETQTLATITLQNYFRMYKKLAGMTGTAVTEAPEFWEIYKLDVTVIPTNKPVARTNYNDCIHRTKREKYNAVINEIEEMITQKRPVLVGTVSVDVSETLSRILKRKGVRHSVLNAKYHQQEAEIVSQAGRAGTVTIATNMAGRGTDIKLGQGVREAGGLHIVGTERHESRRIDLQLRGRCARQGDPGSSKFFLSLEDDLMRLFGSERIASVMDRLGVKEGEVITHPMINRSIERAQKKVEAHNFSIRKHLLEYDDVMNKQREIIYSRRNTALLGGDLKDEIQEMIDEFIEFLIDKYTDKEKFQEEWNWNEIEREMMRVMLLPVGLSPDDRVAIRQDQLEELLKKTAHRMYEQKEALIGSDLMRQLERIAVLKVIDDEWKEHLYALDQMKEGINLRAYGQKDPLIEYKREAFDLFQDMLDRTTEETLAFIYRTRIEGVAQPRVERAMPQRMTLQHESITGFAYAPPKESAPGGEAARAGKHQPVRIEQKIGRNDPCPCGSGKKYKKCHGMNA